MTDPTSSAPAKAPPTPKERFEKAVPDLAERLAVFELFARLLEDAHDERADAWYVATRPTRVRLNVARLRVCEIRQSGVRVAVMGPLPESTIAVLGLDPEDFEEWKAVPGAFTVSFAFAKSAVAYELLKLPYKQFLVEACARIERRVSLETHASDIVSYVASVLQRDLPQPTPAPESEDDDADDEPEAERAPVVRGRPPLFNHSQRTIGSLLSDITEKTMALPDLQRPFVWEDTKVRDLLDSIFVGYPVGTLVLWNISAGRDARSVGGPDALQATSLIIDGQQRLTSLFAVMKRAEVTEKDGSKRRISIAFRPRDGRFDVTDAAIRNDPEYLPDVTPILNAEVTKGKVRKELLQALKAKGREISEEYESAVEENLDRLQALTEYQFPVVTIQNTKGSNEASEEDVAEIFVRINNQGTRLGQADFVLTLLSVFHGSLRDRIEARSVAMSKDAVIDLDTQQLLRVACAVGFRRARMSAVYKLLRGVDGSSSDASVEARKWRLAELDRAADDCMDSTAWRDFMLRVMHAGFVSDDLVASNAAVVNAYALYVIGKRIGVPKPRLDETISRWLFGALVTARYSASSETVFEEDLARVGSLKPGDVDAFVGALDAALAEDLTESYWGQTLVSELETQRSRAPSALAFRAAQVVLGARGLFGDQLLSNLFAPPGMGKRAATEAHHLFPKAWLASKVTKDRRRINQVANLAHVGWHENMVIGAQGPALYVPRLRERLNIDDQAWGRMCAEHALPLGWESMEYDTFLEERRRRMAEVTRVAFRQLGGEGSAAPVTPPWFLLGAEHVWKRIADTERALRKVVVDVYVARYGDAAAAKIEAAIPEPQRESLTRALRARPTGAPALSVVDYLYLGQLPPLLFSNDVWADARVRLGGSQDAKAKLQQAIQHLTPVRNEIAHVREVSQERLQKANVLCAEVIGMVGASSH